MVSKADSKELDSPSMNIAFQFWKVAQEEFSSSNIIRQKDACEKAYRAATEAIDTLLAFHGKYIPVGTPSAHLKRSEYLESLSSVDFKYRAISRQYSEYIHILHGICFYSSINPKIYQKVFDSVNEFLKEVELILI